MADKGPLEKRIEAGRALRTRVPRASHYQIGNVKRDPVKLLEASSAGRIKRLVPLRYGRMLASPFAFYRGSAAIQAHDLATTPHTGLSLQICGDAHLMNFGGFATPERSLVFDLNDFDETYPGPWEWDLKRLVASFAIAARHLGLKKAEADEVVFNAVQNYCHRMARCAEKGTLALWYEKVTFDYLLKNAKYEQGRKQLTKMMEKASQRTHDNLLPKMAQKKNGRWVMADALPTLFHVQGKGSLISADERVKTRNREAVADVVFERYLQNIHPAYRNLLRNFERQDWAFKAVGVGSVGTRCLVVLLTDVHDQPLFLQMKQATRSVLAPYVPARIKSDIKHEGERVVVGQRLMQSASDIFLGWAMGFKGIHFYFRQLRDMKVSIELELLSPFLFSRYCWLCCDILARSHARSGGMAAEISGYLGKGNRFGEAMVKYAKAYADQTELDFNLFRTACRDGRLVAQSEADFVRDLRL